MLLPQQQSLLTELIQNTVVRVCVEHVPFEGRLELDGLVCINSDVGGARQIVVKIHTVVGRKDVVTERTAAQKTTWPAAPCVTNKNGLSHTTDDNEPIDARTRSSEEALSAGSEVLQDGDYRPSEVVDERLPPWSHHAPQILKLLTKTDVAAEKPSQTPSNKIGPTTGAERTPDVAVKRESAVNEEVNSATEVEMTGGYHSAKWRCKMCQLLCPNFSELEAHMRSVHVRFVCRLCLNSFTLSCNLRRHMKLHAGVRPHSCPFCSASFSRSTDLKIHMKKHPVANTDHETDSPKSTQEPLSLVKQTILHECDVCGKGFAAAAHLAEHRHTHSSYVESQPVVENKQQISDGVQVTAEASILCQNHVDNASAPDQQDSIRDIASGAMDLAETVREFAPLFQLGDAGVDVANTDETSVLLATIREQTNANKAAAPSRNKRKGLPVKHVNVGADDCEIEVDGGESSVRDAVVAKHETKLEANRDTDVAPSASSQIAEEQAENTSSDLESKIFNCQYAGGCSVTCHGFTAYDWHYMTAHGGRYPCSLCSQSFTSRNNRRRHTDGHAGAAGHGRHQCVTCGKRFARADIIKEHRLTHTRSYQLGTCSKCSESCGTKKSSLLLHLKRCLTVTDIDADIDHAKVIKQESTE